MGRFIRLTCQGSCHKVHRFSKSYVEKIGFLKVKCRPCFKKVNGEPRPKGKWLGEE